MARLFKPQASKRRSSGESTPSTLLVDDLSLDGRGVARHEGKAVFIAGALPGERVQVANYRRQKSFSECDVKQIELASDCRVEPKCEYFGHCGGCQLQQLESTVQIQYKQASLLSLLQRQQRITPETVLPAVISPGFGYRSRVRLGVNSDRQLSFRKHGSDQLVAIKRCEVIAPSLNELLVLVQGWLNHLPAKCGVTHVELIEAASGTSLPAAAVIVRHIKPLDRLQREALSDVLLTGVCWFQGSKHGALTDVHEQVVEARMALSLPVYDSVLEYHPGDFTQVNPRVNAAMIDQALEWLELVATDRVADLFCGIGNFTLPLARSSGHVIGVEAVEAMVTRGRENSALNGVDNVAFKAIDLSSEALNTLLDRHDINKLVLDPPRAGAKYVCEQMAASAVERLVYVSCNPASFARDAAILVKSGFRLHTMRALDMFPQTAHMETMALFVRA